MKRIVLIAFMVFILFPQNSKSIAAPTNNSANAATVIDVSSGRILYEKNADQQLSIASLTKIMTAIVAIEVGELKDKVKASKNAVRTEGSSIYLREDEELSLEDLLYGLMLRSGNDAAVAIAEHVGGSVEGFAYLMNEKANYIGLTSSHFVNPHGLDHRDHYSSARDLAILTAYALKDPTFQKIVSTQVKTAPLEGYDWDRKWFNKNKMLRFYDGADGVKTGYTKIAKRCLVSSATRDGRQVVVVVINDGNDWNDSAKLLDYGFNQFQNIELVRKNLQLEYVDPSTQESTQFVTTRNSIYPLMENETDWISSQIQLNKTRDLRSPDAYLEISLNKTIIDRVPLTEISGKGKKVFLSLSDLDKEKKSFWQTWVSFWRYLI